MKQVVRVLGAIMMLLSFGAVDVAWGSIGNVSTNNHSVALTANSGVNTVVFSADSVPAANNGDTGQEKSKVICWLRRFWGWVAGGIIVLPGFLVKYKVAVEWIIKLFSSLKGKDRKTSSPASAVDAKVGDIINTGPGTVVNNFNITSSNVMTKDGGIDLKHTPQTTVPRQNPTSNEQDNQRTNRMEFAPFRKKLFGKSLDERVLQELLTVESLHVVCNKDEIKICIVDDRDSKKCKKGLELLGYKNVMSYKKCPSFDELKTFSIAFFDIKGVGNQAGGDGLSLAEEFKRMYPTRMVIVRSGIISEDRKVEIENQGKVDRVLVKDRDFGRQVGPVLQQSNVGDPVAIWKMERDRLLKKKSTAEVAVIEHKYVAAINLLSGNANRLPGNWMTTVNELLGGEVL